ncbi:MAG: hypothetical protein ACK59R_15525, partial [Pseudomonadota bacterium]
GFRRSFAALLLSEVAQADHVAPLFDAAERLARVVLRAHRREILDAGWWDRWIDRIAAPSPLPSWRAAFGSEPGLARRHNVRAFLLALAHLARRGGEPGDAALLAACDRALDRIDGA